MPPGQEISIVDREETRKEDYHEETDHETDQRNQFKIGSTDFGTAVVDQEMMTRTLFNAKSATAPGPEMTHLKDDHQMDLDQEITPMKRTCMKPMQGIDPDHEIYLRKGMTDGDGKTIWKEGLNRETDQSETMRTKDESRDIEFTHNLLHRQHGQGVLIRVKDLFSDLSRQRLDQLRLNHLLLHCLQDYDNKIRHHHQ